MKAANAAILDQINMVSRTQNKILALLDRLNAKPEPTKPARPVADRIVRRHLERDARVQDESES